MVVRRPRQFSLKWSESRARLENRPRRRQQRHCPEQFSEDELVNLTLWSPRSIRGIGLRSVSGRFILRIGKAQREDRTAAAAFVGPVTNLPGQIDDDRPDIEGSSGDAHRKTRGSARLD